MAIGQRIEENTLLGLQELRKPHAGGADIIAICESTGLDTRLLYEAVIDLTAEGLFTAGCINIGAGILLRDLGLPDYFFQNISRESLKHILGAISSNITLIDGRYTLNSRVAHVDFQLGLTGRDMLVRIATEESRDLMEKMLEMSISGHRREYYFNPATGYFTYIIRPETARDFEEQAFADSRFLFSLTDHYPPIPEATRQRYEQFLLECEEAQQPLVTVTSLPETGETRFMFDTNFESPQLPLLRKIFLDHGLVLTRAYWEPYRAKTAIHAAICSFYINGELDTAKTRTVIRDVIAFLAWGVAGVKQLYIEDRLSLNEMIFAGIAIEFARLFIFQETENRVDLELLERQPDSNYREIFASRIHRSNKATYRSRLIEQVVVENIDLIRLLYELFASKFQPERACSAVAGKIDEGLGRFRRLLESRFIDFGLGRDVMGFLTKLIESTQKTNFYKEQKRSFSFRFDNSVLDPLVFAQPVHAIFFVTGHYGSGTHIRAEDIARGGLRLLRITHANYESELDNIVLLNYTLGPRAQRLKHKDIGEGGAKGVIIPRPHYAQEGFAEQTVYDYTEGILDLLLEDPEVLDYSARREMVFFGPDEGTAPMMDGVAGQARKRGYPHWRTITTGKSEGIPHDAYGLLEDGRLFGLFGRGKQGVELQIDGRSAVVTDDPEKLLDVLGNRVKISGMTTTSVMSTFRTLIAHRGAREEELNLMITGGPDGDLGANQIQCYRGRICLIIDGGGVLFDPQGLDRNELMRLAVLRQRRPRPNVLDYSREKLSEKGFLLKRSAGGVTLPGGVVVEDGALFHRTVLYDPRLRELVRSANIRAFIPCGGFKDTINRTNVDLFLETFQELEFIVEGANIFFDSAARRRISQSTDILQIKDSSANKGGVYSSAVAEVLTPFLLGEQFEEVWGDETFQKELVTDVILAIQRYAEIETRALLGLAEQGGGVLAELSEESSEQIFAFQKVLTDRLTEILADGELVWEVLQTIVPPSLVGRLGRERIIETLNTSELRPYRDAILTKKLASLAFYTCYATWGEFLSRSERALIPTLYEILIHPTIS